MTFPVLSAGTSAYNLQRSLRFRSSASAYLSRTPGSTGNRQIFTWSGWVKRGTLSTSVGLFSAGQNSTNNIDAIEFNSSNQIRVYSYNSAYLFHYETTAVYRDCSAWYHLVVVVDTTHATAASRVKIYVNGTEVTSFATQVTPTQNTDCNYFNTTNLHTIGATYSNSRFFDGYLTEVNFIDGQALIPSSFGSTNAVTGVWQPAKYTGTYGTNGFYLPFTNTTSTTTLGNDFSGNGNNWTTNNISLTPGVTYDAMTDVPTLTSATAANYCVLNPLSTASVFSITNGNLTASSSTSTGTQPASFFLTSGKWYWESIGNAYAGAVCGLSGARFTGSISVAGSNGIGYWEGGLVYWDGGNSGAGPASYTSSDVIGVALNMDAGTVAFYKNNSLQFTATFGSGTVPNLSSGCFPCYNQGQSGSTKTANFNFGQRPFAYTPPSGFVALNTFNLPSSTIPAGNKFMDAILYTGDGTSSRTVGGLAFQPDFVWDKQRSGTFPHVLVDSVRGGSPGLAALQSNATDAEFTTLGVNGGISAIASNGFVISAGSSANTNLNGSGSTYVAWQWKANGAGVTNTSGSITSTVSANTTSGFSVVTYTGTGSTATVGHGLGVAPSMLIVKRRNSTGDWGVYHASLSANGAVFLNLTDAYSTPGPWNNTAPTSSQFTVATGSFLNSSGGTYVAYCFTPIAGFSAFGSYTGNGSTDGPFIYTGFRPKFVLIKNTDTAGRGWEIIDSSRNTFNVANSILQPDAASAESSSSSYQLDFVSNGFKIRGIDTWLNASGGTYIYACFAENPFRNALAR